MSFVRPDIREMKAYAVADVPEDFIKLDAMEVPYRFSETLQQQLAQELSAAEYNRYPNPASCGLQAALRDAFAIPEAAKIALGNGSDELIQLLTMLVAQPGATVMALEPSFVMYRHNAALFGLNYVGVPLNADFSLNRDTVLAALEEHRPALLWLAYPNNPTGVPFAREDVEAVIAAAPGLVVIDEAYGAFSGDSFLPQAGQNDKLLVLRTLSKIGFAGLRLGYVSGSPMVIGELEKIVPPYNMNAFSLIAAKFALQHMDEVNAHIGRLKDERRLMSEILSSWDKVQVFESGANFITVRLPEAQKAFERLKEARILVKLLHGSHALLDNCLRVTIGKPEENQQVLAVLQQHCFYNRHSDLLPAAASRMKRHKRGVWAAAAIAGALAAMVLWLLSGSLIG